MLIPLPIDSHLETIGESWARFPNLIIKATPGSGKTTRVPPFLRRKSGQKILVLEPRRLAAKLSASRVAQETGATLGQEVGYIFRFDHCAEESTPLVYLTEGSFLKWLLRHPLLEGISTVILDEFHERHLETDTALAFLLSLQKTERPDLKLVLMSATLETSALESYLPRAKVINIPTPHFPLTIQHLPHRPEELDLPLERQVYRAVEKAWDIEGDILVFLPGMKEINRVRDSLGDYTPYALILHGDLSSDEQAQAFLPRKGKKIILSTNIAESSVTIPGLRVVIDSGLFRQKEYSPWSGLSRLLDKKISQASAWQRAGRAAREGPGWCYRLYSEIEFKERPAEEIPEILRADLSEILLVSAAWGRPLEWFRPPKESLWEHAREILEKIGSLYQGRLTDIGERMLHYPLAPRMARIMVEAENRPQAEAQQMVDYLANWVEEGRSFRLKKILSSALAVAPISTNRTPQTAQPLEKALLCAFPDHVARYRGRQRHDFTHCQGDTLRLSPELEGHFDPQHEWWVVLEVNHKNQIIKMEAIEKDWFFDLNPFPLTERHHLQYHPGREKITIENQTMMGNLVVDSMETRQPLEELVPELQEEVFQILYKEILKELPEWKNSWRFARLLLMERWSPVKAQLDSFDSIFFWRENLKGQMSWQKGPGLARYEEGLITHLDPQRKIDWPRFLPEKLTLPNQKSMIVHYQVGQIPYLESYIQDFYGIGETPAVATGQLPLVLKLCGPHRRPLQVTSDLKNFWEKTYPELCRELRRDYPRHYWPPDPQQARPVLFKKQAN
jgi:ATP-dependent helicase HrpB